MENPEPFIVVGSSPVRRGKVNLAKTKNVIFLKSNPTKNV